MNADKKKIKKGMKRCDFSCFKPLAYLKRKIQIADRSKNKVEETFFFYLLPTTPVVRMLSLSNFYVRLFLISEETLAD